MKYLGIDYGTKRVGIAVSDDEGSFAFPKGIVPLADAVSYVAELIISENIAGIVVGYSVASNGMENSVTEQVSHFVTALKKQSTVPVVLEREDFSSFEAHRYQTKAGSRDDSAAAIILQRFLDKQDKTYYN